MPEDRVVGWFSSRTRCVEPVLLAYVLADWSWHSLRSLHGYADTDDVSKAIYLVAVEYDGLCLGFLGFSVGTWLVLGLAFHEFVSLGASEFEYRVSSIHCP